MKLIKATGQGLTDRGSIHGLCRNFLFHNIQLNFVAQNRPHSIGKGNSSLAKAVSVSQF